MTFTTVSQMFNHVTNQYPSKELYFYKKENEWVGITGSEIRSTVKGLAFGLQSLSIGKGIILPCSQIIVLAGPCLIMASFAPVRQL